MMHFSTILPFVALGQAGFIALNYWPDSTDCTGRMETLEVNTASCNTGNVIHSYAITACDTVGDLNIFIDGSGCVGDLAGYVSNACDASNLNVCKSAPSGGGSVLANVSFPILVAWSSSLLTQQQAFNS